MFESDLHSQLHGYRLDHDSTKNTLWRLRDSGHSQDRKVVPEAQALDTIATLHCQYAHPRKNKTFYLLREEYYAITKEEVNMIVFWTLTIMYVFMLSILIGYIGD